MLFTFKKKARVEGHMPADQSLTYVLISLGVHVLFFSPTNWKKTLSDGTRRPSGVWRKVCTQAPVASIWHCHLLNNPQKTLLYLIPTPSSSGKTNGTHVRTPHVVISCRRPLSASRIHLPPAETLIVLRKPPPLPGQITDCQRLLKISAVFIKQHLQNRDLWICT